MRTAVHIVAIALVLAPPSFSMAQSDSSAARPSMVFLDLQPNGTLSADFARQMTTQFISQIAAVQKYQIVRQSASQADEPVLCKDDDCARAAATAADAEFGVFGFAGEFDSLYVVLVTIVDTSQATPVLTFRQELKSGFSGFNAAIDSLAILLSYDFEQVLAKRNTVGRLSLTSTPEGALVYLNGRYYGETPIARSNLQPGEYAVLLWHPEYDAVDGKITVFRDSSSMYNMAMQKLFQVEVKSDLKDAVVYVNGNPAGFTPYSFRAREGLSYALRVQKQGHPDWQKTVKIEADTQVKASFRKPGSWQKKAIKSATVFAGGGLSYLLLSSLGGTSSGDPAQIPPPPGRPN